MTFDSDRMLDAWLAPPDSGAPVACVASTFTFDPGFFDEECLARFLRLDSALVSGSDPADSRVFVLEREERLAEVSAAVLVDRGQAQAAASFRWDVIPVTAGYGGVQHSKVTLLAWEHAIRLIVSSGNLTTSGYRSNVEIFSVIDDSPEHNRVIKDAITFLRRIVKERTSGSDSPSSPRARVLDSLSAMATRVTKTQPAIRTSHRVQFLHTLGGKSILEQAFEQVWGHTSPPRWLYGVSPYFDRDELVGVNALRGALARRGEVGAELGIVAFDEGTGDEQVRVLAPQLLRDHNGRGAPELRSWPFEPDEIERVLHAKAYLFESDNRLMLLAGSANATGAGLGIGPIRNIEAVLAISDKPNGELGHEIYQVIPSFAELPEGTLVFDAPLPEGTETAPSLPIGFVEALYHPAKNLVEIELSVDDLPSSWTIRSGQQRWFDESDVKSARTPGGKLRRRLKNGTAPKLLTVTWRTTTDEMLSADMVVAVANPAELPDAPEIADLSLGELLELLAVGGRLYDLLHRLAKREYGSTDGGYQPEIELDPHRKVDTSGFILQRTRRMSRALEGLKLRLGQPISHPDALERRLRGRLGPKGLADAASKAVKDKEMTDRERAFLLAELALIVHQTPWRTVGKMRVGYCRERARLVVKELRPKRTGDLALDRYVKEAFRTALT